MAKKAQAATGTWRDPDPVWEMFHHGIKLHLLCANEIEIDGVIAQLVEDKLFRDCRWWLDGVHSLAEP